MDSLLNAARIQLLFFVFFCLLGLAESPSSFSLFVPTDYQNPVEKRYDALRVEIPQVALSKVGRATSLLGKGHKEKVVLYLSVDRPIEAMKESIKSVKEQFPHNKIEIKVVGEKNTEQWKKIQSALEGSKVTEKIHLLNPSGPEVFLKRVSQLKALAAVVERSSQLSYSGLDPSVVGVSSGATLVTLDAIVNYKATLYERDIGNAFSDHSIPLINRWGFKGLQNFYSNNKVMGFIKGSVANLVVWGLASNAVFQTAGHFANPSSARLPTGEDAGRWAIASAISAPIYFASFRGLEKLRQRGWLTQAGMEKYLKANGFLYQLANLPNNSGNPTLIPWFYAGMGLNWAMELAPAAVGVVLPARNDRIVIMDNGIQNREFVDQLEGLESTKKVTIQDLPKLSKELEKLKPLRPSLLKKCTGLLKSCQCFISGFVTQN